MMAQVRGPATACTAAAGPCANTWIGGGGVLDISMSPVESPSTTPKSPACVYRYYDGSGTLLYVGVTKRGITRNLEHASHKEWWPFVSRQEVDHFPTYREALDCERDLIVACRPPFNKQHNAQHKEMRAAYLRLAQSADNSECESFTSLYNLLGHALPLRRVVESGHDDRITFVTDPRHAVVARTVHLDRPASIRPAGDGANLGVVRTIAKYGQHAILRGRLKDAALPVDGAVLRLKVVSLKKPITTRATIVELRPLLGMDGAE